jgi:hypothetical protein
MKTISKIFGLTLVFGLSFGLSSCSDDDDKGPTPVPQQGSFTKTYSIALNGSPTAANPSLSEPITLKLSDAIGEENAKNFVAGSAVSGTMTIKIRGLQAIKDEGKEEKLQNFTVKVGNNPEVNLGTCSVIPPSGSNFYPEIALKGGNYDKITNQVFELLTKDKQVKFSYKFKPAVTIATSEGLNPVYLDITVSAEKYTYNTYPSK